MTASGVLLAVGLIIGLVIGAGAAFLIYQPVTVTKTTTAVSTTTMVSTATTTAISLATVTQTSPPTTVTVSASASATSGVPPLQPPVAVTVDPKTTALLVLDYGFCYRIVGCNASIPAVQNILKNARAAGALVIYTNVPVKELANQSGEAVITNAVGPEKYLNTSLAAMLQSKGIKNLVITGIAANGALLYTGQESCVKRYNVVIPSDTVVGSDYVVNYVQWQFLNAPGCSNPNNTPLSPNHATLSTTSLIKWGSG
jgi:nicotinamidase-related amidase